MKKIKSFLTLVLLGILLASCGSNLKPFDSKNVIVDPQPLELKGGKVPVTITLSVPAKWFNKKAEVRITPVLRYPGGEQWSTAYNYQGEEVRGNATVVNYETASTLTITASFPWIPEMIDSKLLLLFNAKVDGKRVELPVLTIGEGVVATEALANARYASPAIAPDKFQRVVKERYDADLQFLIQQSNLRTSELKKDEIEEWKAIVESANITPNQKVDIEVQAYASPDGGLELNEKLAADREKKTSAYIKRELKRMGVDAPMNAHYTAQDWDGFRQILERSNIQDKDLVLRVLSMYPDPEVREREIRNISVVFGELADVILPQLRRSRLIANIKIIGKSDREILDLAHKTPSHLTLDELLYAATLVKTPEEKKELYIIASGIYPSDYRAFNNIGALVYETGNLALAKEYFNKAQSIVQRQNITAEPLLLNQALILMADGKIAEAKVLIGQIASLPNLNEVMGLLHLQEGNYPQAAKALHRTATNNGVIAQIQNKDYFRASQLIEKIPDPDALTFYLHAIIAAKSGDTELVEQMLREAIGTNPELAKLLKEDRNFTKYRTLPFFSELVK